MSPLEITLVILLVTIIAFVSGKVPFSVISTGIILALILTGIKTPAEGLWRLHQHERGHVRSHVRHRCRADQNAPD